MERIRITSREVYFYYIRENSKSGGCTNKKILRKRTGISYNTFRKVFDRKGEWYYDNGEVVIIRVRSGEIEKGDRSITRRGKGGMEGFMRYVIRKGY